MHRLNSNIHSATQVLENLPNHMLSPPPLWNHIPFWGCHIGKMHIDGTSGCHFQLQWHHFRYLECPEWQHFQLNTSNRVMVVLVPGWAHANESKLFYHVEYFVRLLHRVTIVTVSLYIAPHFHLIHKVYTCKRTLLKGQLILYKRSDSI